jgi:hypothetical protein
MSGPTRPSRNNAELARLLGEVRRAEAAFRESRDRIDHPGTRRDRARDAERLAEAMQAYADAASESGIPLPYRYRDNLKLFRALNEVPGRERT